MSSPVKSRAKKARERFLLITLLTITTTVTILSIGLFFLSVPLSGAHHNDCSASNCRVTSSSKQLYLQYDLTTSRRNLTITMQVIFDESLLSDQSNTIPCIITPLSSSNQSINNNNNNITENNLVSLLGKTTTTKSSSLDNQQNLESSTRILLMTESSSIIITYNNINYSITTNSSSSDAIPCYYNDANSFFFGMTFSLPKEHAQLELILGGVMIPFIILVVGCLCCLPLSMSWICMKEDIMERKQKVDFHKLDSTWDE
ncbi:predicted protein [Naegleria gruberi]|uniref:Predicted protein n=1 Tax=Naegleria gruberi TaxID=5762 RepID=D2VXX2_NAEGR|nr:uncharacterized protein NAEGRDRAFT_73908 [Naegleria gruberi]EFC38365.1 predicted protein [Naegleria gruberi]|eukprot:XP_002671109.1 predicted protein [Naegleria gruberi strain NEG-M]